MNAPQTIPTVSRVEGDRLIELIYDPQSRTTALLVSDGAEWSIGETAVSDSGETLSPYPASNNLIRHSCVMLPSEPIDHGDKEALLNEIQAYLHRYVDLSPLFERIAAHYVLLSWVFDAFNEVPYLRFQGDYGSGKTRALIALGSIVYRGFFASGASTVSPVFHTLDSFGGTLVLDEADLRFSGKTAYLVKILNNGTVKGLPVLRTVQNRHKEFNPAAFQVFGPKIVAMRGAFRDLALESRFLTEEMGGRPLRPDIPIQLPQCLQADALELRNRLLHFRMTNFRAVQSRPERLIAGIDPRLNQTALPLLSLVDDSALREEIAAMLVQKQRELAGRRANGAEAMTIAVAAKALQEPGRKAIPLSEIAARVAEASEGSAEISPRFVGQVLRSHAVPLRKSNGVIVVPKDAAAALEARTTAQHHAP